MRNPFEPAAPSPEEKRIDLWLWTGFLLTPLAMGVNTIVGFTVAHWTADTGRKHLSYFVSLIDLLLWEKPCSPRTCCSTRSSSWSQRP